MNEETTHTCMCLYTHKRRPNEENPALWEKTDRGDVFTSAWEKKGGEEEENWGL